MKLLVVVIPVAPESQSGMSASAAIQSKAMTQSYSNGWDRIFGEKTPKPSAPN